MKQKINEYIETWTARGYEDGLPDEVPDGLMQLGLAPSYRAICHAILKNDVSLQSLGFQPPKSKYYNALKKIEIAERENGTPHSPS